MSTQDLLGQAEWTLTTTVLTSALARIVDWVSVVRMPPQVLLLTSPDRAGRVRDWLAGYVFFSDEVRLSIVEPEAVLYGIYGPQAGIEVARVLTAPPRLAPGQVASFPDGIVWRVDAPHTGWRILSATALNEPRPGESEGPAAAAAYRALRIEAGVPEFGAEISEESNPLEVGLESAISFAKGCYIGQEIIARMESRGKRARRLVGLRLADEVHAPAPVLRDASEVGRLTTSAFSPALGWIGLAVLRTSALADGPGDLAVGEPPVTARWCELPMNLESGP